MPNWCGLYDFRSSALVAEGKPSACIACKSSDKTQIDNLPEVRKLRFVSGARVAAAPHDQGAYMPILDDEVYGSGHGAYTKTIARMCVGLLAAGALLLMLGCVVCCCSFKEWTLYSASAKAVILDDDEIKVSSCEDLGFQQE